MSTVFQNTKNLSLCRNDTFFLVKKKPGLEAFPNAHLWIELPGLVSDGCRVIRYRSFYLESKHQQIPGLGGRLKEEKEDLKL